MSWSSQGYLFGRAETDYGNGDPNPSIDDRNEHVPEGIRGLSIYYGCSGAEFFRGLFKGSTTRAKAALRRVHMLTVYAGKYGGVCKFEDHIPHLVFLEQSKTTWFFDEVEQPSLWQREVERLLPESLREEAARHLRPPKTD